MKTKIFKKRNTNYFGVAVLNDKKVYLKYYCFNPEEGIKELDSIRNIEDKKAINEIYKDAHAFYFDMDREIKMWVY